MMTYKPECPACGAPLHLALGKGQVVCEYCGTKINYDFGDDPDTACSASGDARLKAAFESAQEFQQRIHDQPTSGKTLQEKQHIDNRQVSRAYADERQAAGISPKNKWVAFFICLFMGWFGAHYFYVGRPVMGILYFFTAGLFCIGWLRDIVVIASGSFKC